MKLKMNPKFKFPVDKTLSFMVKMSWPLMNKEVVFEYVLGIVLVGLCA
jgi:hypothetical protein